MAERRDGGWNEDSKRKRDDRVALMFPPENSEIFLKEQENLWALKEKHCLEKETMKFQSLES